MISSLCFRILNYFDKNTFSFMAWWMLITGLITVPLMYFWDDLFNPTVFPAHSSAFFVSDYSGVLTDDTEAYIIRMAKELESQTKAQIVVATVPETGGKTLEDYSLILANSWGIGDRELNNGILLLFATEPVRVRLEVGLGLEGRLPDGKAGRILDDYAVKPKAAGHWNMAAQNTFNAILREIWEEYRIGSELPKGAELSFLAEEPETAPGVKTRADMPFVPDPEFGQNNAQELSLIDHLSVWGGLAIISMVINFFTMLFALVIVAFILEWKDPAAYRKTFMGKSGGHSSGGSGRSSRGSSSRSYSHSSSGHHGGGGHFGGGGASR